jgi:glycosyltransferase involved in cell wall biosynthesis
MKINHALYWTSQVLVDNDGVTQKVKAQCQALESIGIKTSLLAAVQQKGRKVSFEIDGSPLADIIYYFLYVNNKGLYSKILDFIIKNKVQLLYVRYGVNASSSLINLFKRCHEIGCKIVLEFPTYPYDGEIKGLKQRIIHTKEKWYRKQLHEYIDLVVTYSLADKIYGIPTAHISNAVAYIPKLCISPTSFDSIRMIAVANIAYWHGLDRVIEGINKYYQNNPLNKVYLDIVGDGDLRIMNELRSLVCKYNLKEYIHFVGGKSGEELDKQFVGKHIAIGSLGRHRSGISQLKTLKNAEYAMRGIPFIYSEDNCDFDDKCYVLKVPADESPIDIQSICDFVKRQKWSPAEIRGSVGHLTWNNQMLAILDKLNSNV